MIERNTQDTHCELQSWHSPDTAVTYEPIVKRHSHPSNNDRTVSRRCARQCLDYELDVTADLAINHESNFVELQASAEQGAMSRTQLDQLLDLAERGITALMEIQRSILATQSKREALC